MADQMTVSEHEWADRFSRDGGPTEWIPIERVTDVIGWSKTKYWTWIRNSKCKYIELRIDMRDGHCIIKNRHGDIITIDQLESQIQFERTDNDNRR